MVMAAHGEWFTKDELDIVPLSWKPFEPTYWQKLEHQAAIGAMQGILSNPEYLRSLMHTKHDDYRVHEVVPNVAIQLSHTLVQELKEKEEKVIDEF